MFASAMDLIVAADDAMFLPSLTQYFSAPWDVGIRKSKEILFQSRCGKFTIVRLARRRKEFALCAVRHQDKI